MNARYFLIIFLTVGIIILPSLTGQASPVYLGKGCTTLTYMDYDCDGYVIGGKDGDPNSFSTLDFPDPLNLNADANDNDSNLNDIATVVARYGQFTDINNFKQYLYDLGYTHTINDVFFISLDGNDTTAEPNNINLPYRNSPRLNSYAPVSSHVIGPGDVVVFRGGIWPEGSLSTFGSFECVPNVPGPGCTTVEVGVQGNSIQPIVYINYPSERAIIRVNLGFGTARNTSYVNLDGFEFDGVDINGNIIANEIFRIYGPGDHITFKNLEIRNAGRWGIFGVIDKDRNYYTLDKVSIHHINGEHCIYRNDIASQTELDTDFGWVIKNSIFYNCRYNGIHWRGGKNFTFEDNIIHTTGLNGIDIKNSPENGIIKNNLIFNNGHGPILIFEDNDPQRFAANGTNNILITQNTFAARSGTNGAGGENSAFSAVRFTHYTNPPRIHKNVKIYNNIIYTVGATPIYFDYSPDISEVLIEKNIFYRLNAVSPNDGGGMSVLNWTDGTHNSSGLLFGLPIYTWNFDSMQNPILRPQITNNLFTNPYFVNVNNSYTINFTPWLYDFYPTQNSPSVDFGLLGYSTLFDLKGKTRGNNVDAGAYEFANDTGTTGGTTTSGSSGGSSGSSSGGGGSSSGSFVGSTGFTSTQCNDNLDNDGDGLVDYFEDPGCVAFNDESELNIASIVSEEISEEESIGLDNEQRPFEIRAVLWISLAIISLLIVAVLFLIIRNIRFNARHKKGSYY